MDTSALFIDTSTVKFTMPPSHAVFEFRSHDNNQQPPVLKLNNNGDIFVRGRLIENDKEVVDAWSDIM